MSGRSWCYTLNNPTEEEVEFIKCLTDVAVHVAAHEVGESGTPHIQGYIRFHKVQKLAWWKKRLPRVHVELRRARDENGNWIKNSETHAFNYCLKDVPEDKSTLIVMVGSPTEPATTTSKNRNEEAMEVIEMVSEGSSFNEICKQHPSFCFFHRRHLVDWMYDRKYESRVGRGLPPSNVAHYLHEDCTAMQGVQYSQGT